MNAFTVMLVAGLTGGLFGVDGSGKIKEQARQVGEFTGVAVGGSIEADVRIGKDRKVTVTTDDNLQQRVKLTVRNGVLHAELTESVNPTRGIKLTVVTPQIEYLEASGGSAIRAQVAATKKLTLEGSGGAELDVTGIDAEAVSVELSGGVDAKLVGKAATARYELSGGVDLNATGLAVETVSLEASGGVDAELAASKAVTGETSGGVSVKVKGRPAVNVEASGGSSIVTAE